VDSLHKEPLKILELIRGMIDGRTALAKIGESEHSSPFRVLISTMLSARTKDSVTDVASERLFSRYADSKALSRANPRVVGKLIKPVNFYKTKAKRIILVARTIQKEFGGKVPRDFEKLLELPGVGRKTANCVLVYGFQADAIPVDVHVHRISNRIGLVKTAKPEQTEEELSKLYDRRYWLNINELFVRFGQTICRPVGPKCETCKVSSYCDYFKTIRAKAN
jgi:endonuclease III